MTVALALAANLGIAIAKIVAATVTGSASMAAEAGHSIADSFNELLLLAALRRVPLDDPELCKAVIVRYGRPFGQPDNSNGL